MFDELLPYKINNNTITLNIKVVPKSSSARIGEVIKYDDRNFWKIYITSVPQKGKANNELIKLLSQYLDLSKTKLKIIKGANTPYKTLQIDNISDNFALILNSVIFGH